MNKDRHQTNVHANVRQRELLPMKSAKKNSVIKYLSIQPVIALWCSKD